MLTRLDKVENLELWHNLSRVFLATLRGLLLALALDCEVTSEQYHNYIFTQNINKKSSSLFAIVCHVKVNY